MVRHSRVRLGNQKIFSDLAVEKLLVSQIPAFHTHDIKLKRTKQLVDRTSFVLKIATKNTHEKIAENRVNLYIVVLIGHTVQHTLIDLCTNNEQVFLVQCSDNIGTVPTLLVEFCLIIPLCLEFDKVYQQYKRKPQLQGRDLSLLQIFECDTITIRHNEAEKMMTYDDIENILRPSRFDVFTYQLTEDNCVEVEFVDANGKIPSEEQ
jgi:hypothetical protein